MRRFARVDYWVQFGELRYIASALSLVLSHS